MLGILSKFLTWKWIPSQNRREARNNAAQCEPLCPSACTIFQHRNLFYKAVCNVAVLKYSVLDGLPAALHTAQSYLHDDSAEVWNMKHYL